MSDDAASQRFLTEIPPAYWPGIFPMRPGDSKKPGVGWKRWTEGGYERAAAGAFDFEERDRYCRAKIDEGIALAMTMPYGDQFVVIDCDTPQAVIWLEPLLPDGTPVQKRHEGSLHAYLRYDSERFPLKNWTGINLSGSRVLDLRIGGKGYVVIPPSTHDDGRPYQWIEQLPADPADIPELPEEIAVILMGAAEATKGAREFGAQHNVAQSGFDRCRSYIGRLCRYETNRERVEEKAREFATTVYGDRPERLQEHLEGDHVRLVEHMWNEWGGAQPLREMNNDEAVVELFMASVEGERWAYVDETKEYMHYERGVWRRSSIGKLRDAFARFADDLFEDANRETADPDRRERLATLAMKLKNNRPVTQAVSRYRDRIETRAEDWEINPWLIPFNDGSVFDAELDEVRELEPQDMVTRTFGVQLDIEPVDTDLVPFLEATFPDPENRAYIQRCLGLSLLGRVFEEHVFLFMFGKGSTGKSTFLTMAREMFGDFGSEVDFLTFCDNPHGNAANATPNVAGLRGIRFACCTETPDGVRIGSKMKTLTGDKRVPVRDLYQSQSSMRVDFTPWVAGNVRPSADALDSGVERRLKILPANQVVPDERQDKLLPARLGRPGALRALFDWAIEGLDMVIQDGGELGQAPEAVRVAKEEYQRENDPLAAWMMDCCDRVEGAFLPHTELIQSLDAWGSDEFGEEWHSMRRGKGVLNQRRLKAHLEAQGITKSRRGPQKARVWGYGGLRLKGGGATKYDASGEIAHLPR